MTLATLIIRLEGVFALTGSVYFEAMNEALAEAGFCHRITPEAFAEKFGHDVGRELFLAYASRHLFPRKQTSDLRTLFEVTYKHLRQCAHDKLATARVEPGLGILDLLSAAQAAGIHTVLITGMPLTTAEKLIVTTAGPEARSLFDRVIKQDSSNPAAAFAEARALALGPALALESSTPGLAAAQSVGIPSVAVIGQSVLESGIHGAREVVDKIGDLLDEPPEGGDLGRSLLQALNRIVKTEAVVGVVKKIIDLQVRDVLRDKGDAVKTVNPTDTVQFLAERLRSCQVGALVVIGDTGALEGIVSERDLARGLAQHGAAVLDMPVSAIMTRAVITCAPVDSIHTVAKVMTARRIRHLPVSEDGRLVGLISIGDVLNRRLDEVRYQATVLRKAGPDVVDALLPDQP